MCAVRASSCSLISCTLPSSCERFAEKSIKSKGPLCLQTHLIKKNTNPVLLTKSPLNNYLGVPNSAQWTYNWNPLSLHNLSILYFKALICINYNYCVSLNKNWLDLTWKDCVTSRNGECHSWAHKTVIWVSVKNWCDLALFRRSESGNDTQRSEEEKTAREVRQEGEGNSFPSLSLLLLFSCCRCCCCCFRSLFHATLY